MDLSPLCATTKRVSCSLQNFFDDVKNSDVTVSQFRSEVSSIESLLITINTCLKAYTLSVPKNNAAIWTSIQGILEDCGGTINRLDSELDRIQHKNSRASTTWKKAYSSLRLDMNAYTVKTLRSRVRTHVGALQLSLSCISVCLLLKVPARTAAGGLQNATIVSQLAAQIEALKRNIVEVGRLLEMDRAGQEVLSANIESARMAASKLVESAGELVALSKKEEVSKITSNPELPSWSTSVKRRSRTSDSASHTSTESTRQESIFSDNDIPLASPTSEMGSVSPLSPKAMERLHIRRESRSSISSASSIFARKELQDDRDQYMALSTLGKFEKSAQGKLNSRNLNGAQQDLKLALECCDRIASATAAQRELTILRKLIEVADKHIDASRSHEAELIFNIVTDRCILLLPATGDPIRYEIVNKAEKLALGYLDQGDLAEFGMSSSVANGYRDKIIDDELRARSHDEYALNAAIRASRAAVEMMEAQSFGVEVSTKLCRIALQNGARAYGARADSSRAALYEVQIPRQVNQVVEENIKQRRFTEAEALGEQLVEQFICLSPDITAKANLRRANINLAYSCYAQRSDDKLDKAESILTRSESWPSEDQDLVHATSFLLAQVYWKKSNYDSAENCCWNAMKGRVDMFGDADPRYLEVVSLFVRILERQGQHQESALHRSQLNEDFCRKQALDWVELHLAYESQDEALMRAVRGGYEEAAQTLIDRGGACEELLRRAVFSGDLDSARLLVNAGALVHGDFNNSSRMPESDHPISLADEGGNQEMLKLLLASAKEIDHCSQIYNLGWAVREQRTAIISAFLALGTRPDELIDGTSYIHLAAEHDWLVSLRAMLTYQPNLDIRNSKGDTPLHIAILKGHETIIDALLDGGADIEFKNGPFTPLLLAISEQMFDIVQLLLDLGASPMATADNGINSLHLAVMGNDVLVVAELLSRFPDLINSKTFYGRNALHIAMMECDFDMARLLVDLGVDVNVRTSMGNSAWDLSRRREHRDKSFETLVHGKMSPKPSKWLGKMNAALVTDPTRATTFGIGIDY